MEKKQFDDFSPPDGNPFDKIDRKDPVQFNYAKEQWAKERFVKLEMINIYRERMRECYFRENVNYRQNCRDVIKKYWDAFQEYKKTYDPLRPGGSVKHYRPSAMEFWE